MVKLNGIECRAEWGFTKAQLSVHCYLLFLEALSSEFREGLPMVYAKGLILVADLEELLLEKLS